MLPKLSLVEGNIRCGNKTRHSEHILVLVSDAKFPSIRSPATFRIRLSYYFLISLICYSPKQGRKAIFSLGLAVSKEKPG